MKLNNITKYYGEKLILNNINFDFRANNIYVIRGESGIGKTTLLNIIANIDKEYLGNIEDSSVYYISQEVSLLQNYNAYESMILGNSSYDQQILEDLIDILCLKDRLNVRIKNLSGGEQQRVGLIRALLLNVEFLILDEPTKGLDNVNISRLVNVLKQWQQRTKSCIIISSHNTFFANQFTNIISIENKEIVIIHLNEDVPIHLPKPQFKFDLSAIKLSYFKKYIGSFSILFTFIFITIFSMIFLNTYVVSQLKSNYDIVYDSLSSTISYIGVNDTPNVYTIPPDIEDITPESGYYIQVNTDLNNNKVADVSLPDYFFASKNMRYFSKVRRSVTMNSGNIDEMKLENSQINYSFKAIISNDNLITAQGLLNSYPQLYDIKYGDSNLINENDVIIPLHLAYYYSDKPEQLIGNSITIPTNNGDKQYNVVGIYDEYHVESFQELGYIFVKAQEYNTSNELLTLNEDSNKQFEINPDQTLIYKATTLNEQMDVNNETVDYISKKSYKEDNYHNYLLSIIFKVIIYLISILLILVAIKVYKILQRKLFINDYNYFILNGVDIKLIKNFYNNYLYIMLSVVIIIVLLFGLIYYI